MCEASEPRFSTTLPLSSTTESVGLASVRVNTAVSDKAWRATCAPPCDGGFLNVQTASGPTLDLGVTPCRFPCLSGMLKMKLDGSAVTLFAPESFLRLGIHFIELQSSPVGFSPDGSNASTVRSDGS